jgi:starvation-inducible DNA-binding protein
MADQVAERIATLGGSPCGTPGALVARRGWDDYFHWFVRAHLERPDGSLATGSARTEREAAERASRH